MGIEDILKKIEEKNEKDIEHIKKEAIEKCEGINREIEKEIKELKEKNGNEAKAKSKKLKEHMLQEARLKIAKGILKTKSDILYDISREALERLENLSTQEYLSWMGRIILKVAEPGEDEIILSIKANRKRDIEELLKRVNEKLKGKSFIKLSNEMREMDGGFVLKRPRKEINCSFKSLLEEKSNSLRIKTSKLLFGNALS